MSHKEEKHPVVLFDGVCNLCNRSVRFILARDPGGIFKFAPLQSDAGKNIIKRFNIPSDKYGSFVFLENGVFYTKSTAALRLLNKLGGFWQLLYFLIVIPAPLRDAVYDLMAKNRYKWFGRTDECMVPTPEIRGRFLS